MRWICSILVLFSCAPAPQPLPDLPQKPFHIRPNDQPIQLDRLTAKVTGIANHTEPRENLGQFALPTTSAGANALGANLKAKLPFVTDMNHRRFAPQKMRVRLGQDAIPYATNRRTVKKHGSGWKIHEGNLLIAAPNRLPGEIVHIETPFLADMAASLAEFSSDHRLTVSDSTRSGLLLPAPAQAEWAVTLPENAQFSAHVGLEALPIQNATSDGAAVSLVLQTATDTIDVGRFAIKPNMPPQRWSLDLSQWSGQSATISLKSETNGSATHDYVFIGAPTIANTRPANGPRRIVVVGLDTTRPDMMSFNGHERPSTPEIDARIGNFTNFTRAWTPAPRTRPSFRSATTGRRPLDAVGATNLGAILDANGFATAGIVANIHLNPRFGFDQGFDWWNLDTLAKADQQVDRASAWLRQNAHRDTYLFLHIMDPHLFYIAPKAYLSRFTTGSDYDLPERFNRQVVLKWMRDGSLSDEAKEEIRRRYEAELAFTSAQLDRFLSNLDQLPGPSLVIIHSDHGEEFWEHDGFEHNHTLYDEVTKALLMVRPPNAQGHTPTSDMPSSLMDIAPTVLDYAGIQPSVQLDGRSLKPFIEGKPAEERPIDLGHLMYDVEQWGVVAQGHKYILKTATGEEALYDLIADAGEKNNLAGQKDLTPWINALAKAHRVDVGPGWRIQLRKNQTPTAISLPEGVRAAAVMDPEAGLRRRANQAWGEQAKHTRGDVATISLSEDKRTLQITPGSHGSGKVLVLFEKTTPAPNASEWPIQAGTVVLPPPDEATRMRALADDVPAGDEEIQTLIDLGYLSPTPEPPRSPQ